MSHQALPISKYQSGRTRLSYAASGGFVAAIEALMKDLRATIYTRDEYGRSSLHFAAEEGRSSAVAFLLEGSKPDLVNEAAGSGITPLHFTLLRG